MSDGVETYKLGDWKLKNGGTIPDAHIAYVLAIRLVTIELTVAGIRLLETLPILR